MKNLLLVTYAFSLFIMGCHNQERSLPSTSTDKGQVAQGTDQKLSEGEKKDAAQAVRSLMVSYNDAMDELDAEKMLTYFMDSPDFFIPGMVKEEGMRSLSRVVVICPRFLKNLNVLMTLYT